MSLETIPRNQLNNLEQQVKQLLDTIRRAKLENSSLIEGLQKLEDELEEARRARFDAFNSEFNTY